MQIRRLGDILPVALALAVITFLAFRTWELVKAVRESPWLILMLLALVACGLLACWLWDVVRRWRRGAAPRGFFVVMGKESSTRETKERRNGTNEPAVNVQRKTPEP